MPNDPHDLPVEQITLTPLELHLASEATDHLHPTTPIGLSHVVDPPNETPLNLTWRTREGQAGKVVYRGRILDPREDGDE